MTRKRICTTAGTTLLSLLLLVLLAGCTSSGAVGNDNTDSSPAPESSFNQSPVGLHVEGTFLKKADGTPFIMRGVNHAHSWYREYDMVALDAIAAMGANTVRLVLSDGSRWEKDSAETVTELIAQCRSRGLTAVLEVHDATGSNDTEDLLDAARYWCDLAPVLAGTEDDVILNIANEWYGSWSGKRWRDGYVEAIGMIREAGIRNCIMVDTAGWGQYGKAVRDYGKAVFDADPERNTLFSIHMYGMSGRWEWLIRYNLNGVTRQNLCACVGEFGWTHSDGNVKEDYLMEYCHEQGIGWLAWSWKGNSGGVEYLDLAETWDGSVLSDWGTTVIYGPYGLQQ